MARSSFRCLASADLHMYNRLPYARPSADGRTDRLDEQLAVLRQMREEALRHDVDWVFLLGDIFDKSLVDAVTLTHTIEEIVQFHCPVGILPGNHDANSLKGGRFTVEAFGAMKRDGLRFLHSEKPLKFGWLKFWPLAFMPVEPSRQALARMRERLNPEDVNVLLFHNSIIGCTHIGWKCDDGLRAAEVCSRFDYVLAGHFHTHQLFGKRKQGMYLSAPMHHHFGDVGREAGFWILNFHDNGRRDELFIKSDAPRFYKADKLETPPEVVAGDFLRFQIRATHPEWEAMLPAARAYVSALELKGIRADVKHDPIYHHESRMGGPPKKTKAAALTIDEAVTRYVDTPGVIPGTLDKERLKALGRDALSAMRSGHGDT